MLEMASRSVDWVCLMRNLVFFLLLVLFFLTNDFADGFRAEDVGFSWVSGALITTASAFSIGNAARRIMKAVVVYFDIISSFAVRLSGVKSTALDSHSENTQLPIY